MVIRASVRAANGLGAGRDAMRVALPRLSLRAAAAQIPEPATLALLGIGLAGLGFSRRKRIAI